MYESKSRPWNSLDLLSPIKVEAIKLTQEEKDRFEPIVWNDLCSEYDAENFCIMLENSGLIFTDEFISFEKVWRRDEYNHYLGFRRIYNLFYGESEESIIQRLKDRPANFVSLEEFFKDEFKLCLILAYDEIATTRAYNEDIPFYKSLGPDAFNEWIRFVKADEAIHYLNSIRVAQVRHKHRLNEAENILFRILDIDLNGDDYHATFVLDHKGPPFTSAMLRDCVDIILSALNRPIASPGFY